MRANQLGFPVGGVAAYVLKEKDGENLENSQKIQKRKPTKIFKSQKDIKNFVKTLGVFSGVSESFLHSFFKTSNDMNSTYLII